SKGNFKVPSTGLAGPPDPDIVSFDTTTAPSKVIDVQVITGASGEGTIELDLDNNTGIKDVAGNPLSTSTLPGEAYSIDHVPPSIKDVDSSSSNNVQHKIGDTMTIEVIFEDTVTVSVGPVPT